MNKVIISGNLGRDPEEIKLRGEGNTGVKFSVATSKKWRGKDGKWNEKVTWIDCVAWGYPAEKALRTLQKGSLVQIHDAEIEVKTVEGRDGGKRKFWQVVVLGFECLARWKGGQGEDGSSGDEDDTPASSEDEEIPF